MQRRVHLWLLAALFSGAAFVYLFGNDAVQLWDRDEPRYAQTSRQMLQSGDWVVPRFLDTVRTAKPILIYWCQATSMAVLGDTAFAARLPSTMAVLLTLAVLLVAVRRVAGLNHAVWTVFIFATCALAIVSAKMCLTDGVLLLWVTLSQVCVYIIWRRGLSPTVVLQLGIFIGLAGLTKGPVVLGIVLTTCFALWLLRRLARGDERSALAGLKSTHLPIILGVVIAMIFVVVFPWLYLVQVRSPGFVTQSLSHDVIDRARRGAEGHSAFPGFYLMCVWGTFLPWSLLIPAAVVNGWRQRHRPVVRFALAALIGPWVMFELVATKLPHYVLPTYPALAFLTADLLLRAARGLNRDLQTRGFRIATGVVCCGAAFIGLLLPAAVWWTGSGSVTAYVVAMAGGGIMLVSAWGVARRVASGQILLAARLMGITMLALVAVVYGLLLPRLAVLHLSERIAAVIAANGGYGQRGFMIAYKEPSLAFYQGGGLVEQEHDDYLSSIDFSAESAAANDTFTHRWIVVTEKIWADTPLTARDPWQQVAVLDGFTLNKARDQRIVVLKKTSDLSK